MSILEVMSIDEYITTLKHGLIESLFTLAATASPWHEKSLDTSNRMKCDFPSILGIDMFTTMLDWYIIEYMGYW